MDRIKVLFIAGWGRSGSTILGNALGSMPDFFHVGELVELWRYGLVGRRPCACGEPLERCSVWGEILGKAFVTADEQEGNRLLREHQRAFRSHHLPLLMSRWGPRFARRRTGDYLEVLRKLYEQISATTTARVIVDSSKYPAFGYAVGLLPVELYVLHLIRDSRGVAYSWQKEMLRQDTRELMWRYSPFQSALRWSTLNLATEILWSRTPARYLRVNYEGFVEAPAETLERICAFVGEPSRLPINDEGQVVLTQGHAVWGNPNRGATGPTKLRLDSDWRSKLTPKSRRFITAATYPLLHRYGYVG